MIRRHRSLAITVLAVAAAGLSGCSTLSNVGERVNIFNKPKNKVVATKGERIPLIALNQKLEVSDALKGAGFFVPDPLPVEAWPQPQGTPGLWVGNVAAAPNFQVAWKRDIGAGSSRKHHVTATPVVAEGKVFVMDGEATVSAFDAASGAELWSVNLRPKSRRDKEAFGGGVAYDGGRLYVTSGYRFVAALDASNGAVVWNTPTDAPIHDAPAVGQGHVYATDIDNQLLTYDAATGAGDWTYQALAEPARILKASAPAISGDAVIAAFSSGELIAFRGQNGANLWSQTLSRATRTSALSEIRDIAGRPVIDAGDVYAGSHSGVMMAVDLRTGQPKWAVPAASITTPWPAGDAVFIISKAGEVICISRSSGQVYWITDLNKGIEKRKDRALYYGPVLASGRLIAVSSKGYAVALDPQTGAEKSRIKIDGPAVAAPIAAGGMLYLVTAEGDLVAIR